mmetsp:Transcript_24046/g.44645  ORF Transcript_24046/g.44645 Transcript_24046/m.44645 type:complete len:222 (-) Transcript_24046:429-1094(-)
MASESPISNLRSMESEHKQLMILRCKCVVVGDACTGKTALTQVFNSGGNTYPKNYVMTIGAEFSVKQVPIPDTNVIVELYIYDCAGQSIFNQVEMNSKYWENTSAVVVVYDISNPETLQSCSKWLGGVRAMRPTGQRMLGVLVGNKADFRDDNSMDSRAEITRDEGHGAAKELGLRYFETSAVRVAELYPRQCSHDFGVSQATNTGIEEPFKYIAEEFYNR